MANQPIGLPAQQQDMIRRRLNEAPPTLFRPVLTMALNALLPAYDDWLDSSQGGGFVKEHIGITRLEFAKPKAPEPADADDYAADW